MVTALNPFISGKKNNFPIFVYDTKHNKITASTFTPSLHHNILLKTKQKH